MILVPGVAADQYSDDTVCRMVCWRLCSAHCDGLDMKQHLHIKRRSWW